MPVRSLWFQDTTIISNHIAKSGKLTLRKLSKEPLAMNSITIINGKAVGKYEKIRV